MLSRLATSLGQKCWASVLVVLSSNKIQRFEQNVSNESDSPCTCHVVLRIDHGNYIEFKTVWGRIDKKYGLMRFAMDISANFLFLSAVARKQNMTAEGSSKTHSPIFCLFPH